MVLSFDFKCWSDVKYYVTFSFTPLINIPPIAEKKSILNCILLFKEVLFQSNGKKFFIETHRKKEVHYAIIS